MGAYKNITHDKFPRQAPKLGRKVLVCFHYDTKHIIPGTVLREDLEEPGRMIIQLEDGRVVLSTECMYTPLEKS